MDSALDTIHDFKDMTHIYGIKGDYTQHLEGKDIALLISGSVAAENASKIARELRRYGGNVTAYLTKEALKYTTIDLMESATGNRAITELSGLGMEHLKEYDAYLLAPGTANTISKIVAGDGADAVKTTAITAMGAFMRDEAKVIVAPAMHGVMWDDPFFQGNLEKLKKLENKKGNHIKVIDPIHVDESTDAVYFFKEDKAKLADIDTIVIETIRELSNDDLKGVNVLMDFGSTVSFIDNVRYVGNRFRGQLGSMIAKELYLRGANVKAIYGNAGARVGGLDNMPYLGATVVNSFDEMKAEMISEAEKGIYEAIICAAAINDYSVKEKYDGKISSKDNLSLDFVENEKIVQLLIDKNPHSHKTSFKLENKKTVPELIYIGRKRLNNGHNIVVGNLLEETYGTSPSQHISYIMSQNGDIIKASTNIQIANTLLDSIGHDLRPHDLS